MFALLALALAPGCAIALFIYLHDKHEREPVGLLLAAFVYGAVSTYVTSMISQPVELILHTAEKDVIQQFFNAFFKVALIEEFSKFIIVRFVLYYNRNFNEPFDGIVYAVMVSMGFATVENIVYVFQYGITTGVLRIFTAVPAHAAFAVMMGYYLGKAKFTHHRTLYYSTMALLSATFFHGLYDYFWFISFVPGLGIGAFVALAIAFWFARKAMRLHQQISPFLALREAARNKPAASSTKPGDDAGSQRNVAINE